MLSKAEEERREESVVVNGQRSTKVAMIVGVIVLLVGSMALMIDHNNNENDSVSQVSELVSSSPSPYDGQYGRYPMARVSTVSGRWVKGNLDMDVRMYPLYKFQSGATVVYSVYDRLRGYPAGTLVGSCPADRRGRFQIALYLLRGRDGRAGVNSNHISAPPYGERNGLQCYLASSQASPSAFEVKLPSGQRFGVADGNGLILLYRFRQASQSASPWVWATQKTLPHLPGVVGQPHGYCRRWSHSGYTKPLFLGYWPGWGYASTNYKYAPSEFQCFVR